MPLEDLHNGPGSALGARRPEAEGEVPAAAGQEEAARGEGGAPHLVGVPLEDLKFYYFRLETSKPKILDRNPRFSVSQKNWFSRCMCE